MQLSRLCTIYFNLAALFISIFLFFLPLCKAKCAYYFINFIFLILFFFKFFFLVRTCLGLDVLVYNRTPEKGEEVASV